MIFAVVAILSAVVAGVAVSRQDDGSSKVSAQRGGEVFLEPARYPGETPFASNTGSLVPGPTPVILPASTTVPSTTEPATTTATTTTATTTTATTTVPGAVASTVGTTPGLYGGTRNAGSCDVAAIDAFLAANPDKAAAWAGALGIAPADISRYLKTLTPVVLLADTRVTNHGYRNGKATPLQSVLQAGTAVLLDATGVPRVKCACGNPLKEPVARTEAVTYTGYPWAGYDPVRVVVVAPGPVVVKIVIQDLAGGPPIARPVGTGGAADTDAPADVAATIKPVKVYVPPATTTTMGSTTTKPGSSGPSGPTTTVLPAGEFCTRVRAYEALMDRDYQVDNNGNFIGGKTDAQFASFLDAALRELAAVAPSDVAADFKTVSDWWKPTMTARDLFGEGAPVPADIQGAVERTSSVLSTRCPG